MAKFNVGDRCIHTDIVGHMDKCIVTKADKPGRYTVEFYLGGEKEVAESSLRKLTNAARSTNSIVAKAMNAVARNGKRVATNREIPAQTAIDYFKKLIAEMESLDKKIRPMVTRFKTLVADGNTSSMDFPDRKIVGKPEELRELDKLKDRFEELRDFAKMTMGI